jgi:hypothetical protein
MFWVLAESRLDSNGSGFVVLGEERRMGSLGVIIRNVFLGGMRQLYGNFV